MQPIAQWETTPAFNLVGDCHRARGDIHRTAKAYANALGMMLGQDRRQFFSHAVSDHRPTAGGIHAKSTAIDNAPLSIAHHDLLLGAADLDADTGHGVKSTATTSPPPRSIRLGGWPCLDR